MKNYTFLIIASLVFLNVCNAQNELSIKHIVSDQTKKMNLPFSDAVIVGNMVYLSGQIGNLPGEMKLVPGGIRAETIQAMKKIEATLGSIGVTMDQVVKCTIMIEDISQWGVFNEEYVKFFPGKKPARSAFGADGLALGANVEIECMASKN